MLVSADAYGALVRAGPAQAWLLSMEVAVNDQTPIAAIGRC